MCLNIFLCSHLVDFLCTVAGSGAGAWAWPGGEVELVVLELSGSPESKLLLLRASCSSGTVSKGSNIFV